MESENILASKPIGKLMLKLAIPTVLAQLVNLLYNIVDRIFVGHINEIGSLALAGLGVTFPIIIFIGAFSALLGTGGAPRAAIAMGCNDNERAEKILGNCTMMLIICSIILSVFFMITKDKILIMFGASENTLPYASSYITIYLIGTMFLQLTLGLNAFITNQGFSDCKSGCFSLVIWSLGAESFYKSLIHFFCNLKIQICGKDSDICPVQSF